MFRVGIDVGGTNTDAVLMQGAEVIAATKTATTSDLMSGVVAVLEAVIRAGGVARQSISAVMLGTTHFTNAVAERRNLVPVGVLRLGLPATTAVPPLTTWPDDIRVAVQALTRTVHGGYEFDGREIAAVREAEIRDFAAECGRAGIRHFAISGVFSTINNAQEAHAAQLIHEVCPGVSMTLSSDIGRISLIDRENATVLNAALCGLGSVLARAFANALREAGVAAPFFLTQNDGTLMSAERAAVVPIMTVASGPTNSMRGAAFLSGCKDALVVDVGGTTSDIGVLQNGFPRQAGTAIEVGGVRTNFQMPDVLSLALGGGTEISDNLQKIGPRSVGYRITSEALVFGGTTLTATDIAVACGADDIGDRGRVSGLGREQAEACLKRMRAMIELGVEQMRTSSEPVPVIAVGGGSLLVGSRVGSLERIVPPHHTVANAVGAAMAQVSGEVDRVVALAGRGRDQAIADLRSEATLKAVQAGADARTIQLVDIEDVPLAYMPGDAARIRIRVVGDLLMGTEGEPR